MGFEPTISVGERQQTYALDRAATGTGTALSVPLVNSPALRVKGTRTSNLVMYSGYYTGI